MITAEAALAAAVLATGAVVVYEGLEYADRTLNKDGKGKSEQDSDWDTRPYDGEFLGNNPEVCPQEGFKWRGRGKPGSREGGYYNGETKGSLRPDFHAPGHKPHWDYSVKNRPEKDARLKMGGTWEWKK